MITSLVIQTLQTDLTRVTHHALRWMHAAQASQWNEELYIPTSLLNNLALWLAEQQLPDGSYKEISTTYDPNMEVEIFFLSCIWYRITNSSLLYCVTNSIAQSLL